MSLYVPYNSEQEFIEKDNQLNKTFIDVASCSLLGFGTGLALSLFFKNKLFIRNFFTGMGAGYAIHYNAGELVKSRMCPGLTYQI